MSGNDLAAVLEANARFYRVFEDMDLAAMEAVWAHGEHVACVHPGWPLLSGWEAVQASWSAILANPAEMRFTLTDVRPRVSGDFAWVTCTENILSETGGRIAVTSVLATNLFERGAGGWRMTHHHASHILRTPADA